jgi:hypothetical protein
MVRINIDEDQWDDLCLLAKNLNAKSVAGWLGDRLEEVFKDARRKGLLPERPKANQPSARFPLFSPAKYPQRKIRTDQTKVEAKEANIE